MIRAVFACVCAACHSGAACSGDSANIQRVKFHGTRTCPLLPQKRTLRISIVTYSGHRSTACLFPLLYVQLPLLHA